MTMDGHGDEVTAVAITPDGRSILSGSRDQTLKDWDMESGRALATFEGHTGAILAITVTPDGKSVVSSSLDGTIKIWDLGDLRTSVEPHDLIQYAIAKVALIGDSGVGKTGLAVRLVEDRFEATTATHGLNVWQLNLHADTSAIKREIWLWDFAGQAGYRLIDRMFMDEVAVALIVFDPQREGSLESLEYWERALEGTGGSDPGQAAARRP